MRATGNMKFQVMVAGLVIVFLSQFVSFCEAATYSVRVQFTQVTTCDLVNAWRVITAPVSDPSAQTLSGVIDNDFGPDYCGTTVSSVLPIDMDSDTRFWLQSEGFGGDVSDLSNSVDLTLPPSTTTTVTVSMTTTTTIPEEILVDFDNPPAPASLSGVYGGIDWGVNQWAVWDQDDTMCPPRIAYMTCAPEGCRVYKCRSFSFLTPAVLHSFRASSFVEPGQLTLQSFDEYDDLVEQYGPVMVPDNACWEVQTGWTASATRVEMCFAYGADLVIDNVVYSVGGLPATTTTAVPTTTIVTTTTLPPLQAPMLEGTTIE